MKVNIKNGRSEALYSHDKPTVSINQTGTDKNGIPEYMVDLGIPSGSIGVKANELRLGNWVKYIPKDGMKDALYRGRPNFYQVTCVGGGDKITPLPQLYLQGAGGYLSLHDFDSVAPIPLAKELLLKCGFKVERESGMSKHYYTNKKILLIDNQNDSYDPRLLCDYQGGSEDFPADKWFECYGVTIAYLHQLQNLFFALTSEELEVKL